MTAYLIWAPSFVATALAVLARPYSHRVGRAIVGLAALSCAIAAVVASRVVAYGPFGTPTDTWRVDALSAAIAVCITVVSLLASALGPGVDPHADVETARRFSVFQNAFALTMLIAVTANNVALMWVAIEATTIVSAILIPLYRSKASVEASWKYLLICSVGIALAFTGTVLAYFDFVATAGRVAAALDWTVLRDAAPSLHPELMQLAFVFVLVGYGTKAGLAPMHTWLPDAHSEAPPAISAMMSGVLLAVGLYAIARWKAVADLVVPAGFTDTLLIAAGLLSIAIGSLSLVIQRHYKRMLAYSTVEHMGLVSVGLALGPAGVFAALLHVVNHAVAKAMAFLLAGRILHRYQTSDVARVSGLLHAMPWTGRLFAVGMLTLVGLPPFGMFVSEFLLLKAAFASGRAWLAVVILGLLLTAFVSLLSHLHGMLYGAVPEGVAVGEPRGWGTMALAGCAVVLVVLGIVLPGPIVALLDASASVLR